MKSFGAWARFSLFVLILVLALILITQNHWKVPVPTEVRFLERATVGKFELVHPIDHKDLEAAFESTHWDAGACHFPEGIEDLIHAKKRFLLNKPNHRRKLADLGAAYVASANCRNDGSRLFQALEYLYSALKKDTASAPILYNRALAVEKLGLRQKAIALWQQYLGIENCQPWIDEGNRRIAVLEHGEKKPDFQIYKETWSGLENDQRRDWLQVMLADYPRETHDLGQLHLLRQWAEALARGESEKAARALSLARETGEECADLNNDALLKDAVAAIQSGQVFYQNVLDFFQAHRFWTERRFDEGAVMFRRAAEALEGCNPYADFGLYLSAVCDYEQTHYAPAMETLEHLITKLAHKPYPLLMGRILQLKGLIKLKTGYPETAQHLYLQAMAYYNEMHHPRNQRILLQLADAHYQLGQWGEVWELTHELLNAMEDWSLEERCGFMAELGLNTYESNYFAASLMFLDEAVSLAETWHQVSPTPRIAELVQALYLRAKTKAALGDFEAGSEDLRQARSLLPETGGYLEELATEIQFTEAQILVEEHPEAALPLINHTIQVMENRNTAIRLPDLFYWRGLALTALERPFEARDSFLRAIKTIESLRAEMNQTENRLSFFNRLHLTIEKLVQLNIEAFEDEEQAFNHAEAGRARTLLEGNLKNADERPQPLTANGVMQRLPSGLALISYVQTDGEIYIWVMRRGDTLFRRKVISKERVNRTITALLENLQDRREFRTPAKQLYKWLVEPVSQWIHPHDTLVFIPDQRLHYIPFGALVDGETQKYLVQKHLVVMAPSASVFIASSERIETNPHWPLSTLAVGKIDYKSGSHDPVGGEIDNMEGKILSGSEATKTNFLRHKDAGILHLGTHGYCNSHDSANSHLLFAPEENERGPGVLYQWQLNQFRFDRTRLVVLAACRTGTGNLVRTEGIISLARPFLAGGAPTVVATLWKIPDQPTVKIITRVYQLIGQGTSPAASFRQAQVEWLEAHPDDDRPFDWAAFQIIGGIQW